MENRNNIFEESYQKAFLRQSFRVFNFSNLSSDSPYLESVTLKTSCTVSSLRHNLRFQFVSRFTMAHVPVIPAGADVVASVDPPVPAPVVPPVEAAPVVAPLAAPAPAQDPGPAPIQR